MASVASSSRFYSSFNSLTFVEDYSSFSPYSASTSSGSASASATGSPYTYSGATSSTGTSGSAYGSVVTSTGYYPPASTSVCVSASTIFYPSFEFSTTWTFCAL